MTDPIAMLKGRMDKKSLRTLAKEIPCSPAYLSDVMRGNRRPGKLILGYLGLARQSVTRVTYEPVNGRKRKP